LSPKYWPAILSFLFLFLSSFALERLCEIESEGSYKRNHVFGTAGGIDLVPLETISKANGAHSIQPDASESRLPEHFLGF
jgi:hypothetical protein